MNANTDEMRKVAAEINTLATNYLTKVDKMYQRISEMPTITMEWTGNQAERYASIVMNDKQSLVEIGNKIKQFAKMINDDANHIDTQVARVLQGEAND